MSALLYRTAKAQGKVRRRVLDLRNPSTSSSSSSSFSSSSSSFPPARGQTLDLSHNESARLAVDCLLSRGLEGYGEVLKAEGEVDFLSELDKRYILENATEANTDDPAGADDDGGEAESFSSGSLSPTCRAASTDSDFTLSGRKQSSQKATPEKKGKNSSDPDLGWPSTHLFFPPASRVAGMKDVVRQFIRKAKQSLAVVADSFSDVELLCDLLEASRKRNVSVHLLLDHLNLSLFVSMWQELKLDSKSFPKLCVRSVRGQTYCARTGRKLTGQIAESFIITDWTEALTGSFSFSWLSWQVHRSLVVVLKGSLVAPFHQELHRLYTSSSPVPGFVTYIAAPPHGGPPRPASPPRPGDKAAVREKESRQTESVRVWTLEENADGTVSSSPQAQPSLQPGGGGVVRGVVGVACSQLQGTSEADPHGENRTSRSHSQTPPSGAHAQLDSATSGQEPKVQELKPQSFQKTIDHLSAVRKTFLPQQKDAGADGLLPQQRERCMLGKHFRTGGLWNHSSSDRQRLLSPPASPQNPTTQFLFNHPRQNAASRQTRAHLNHHHHHHHHHPLLQPHPSSQHPAPAGPGRPLRLQLHPESKGSTPGTGAELQRWSPPRQPRLMERQSSFSAARGTGRPEWAPLVSGVLGRSRSMMERRTEGFRGAT